MDSSDWEKLEEARELIDTLFFPCELCGKTDPTIYKHVLLCEKCTREKVTIDLSVRLKFLNSLKDRLEVIDSNIELLTALLLHKIQTHSVKKSYQAVSKSLRLKILQRDCYTCKNCGFQSIQNISSLHIDHIIPKSKKGPTEEENLQVLCSKCNLIKKNHLFNELKDKQNKLPLSVETQPEV